MLKSIDCLCFSIGARQTWKKIHVVYNRLQDFFFFLIGGQECVLLVHSSRKIFFLGHFIVYGNRYDRPRSVRFYRLKSFSFNIGDGHGSEAIIFSLVDLIFFWTWLEGYIFHNDHITGSWFMGFFFLFFFYFYFLNFFFILFIGKLHMHLVCHWTHDLKSKGRCQLN